MAHDTVPMDLPGSAPTQAPKIKPRAKRRWGVFLLVAVLVVALVGSLAYVATGPYRTLSGLQTAIAQGDAAALSRYVDFAALRQNLKQQFEAKANNGANAAFQNPILSRIAGGIASSVVDATIDTLVTPNGLSRLLSGAALLSSGLTDSSGLTLQQRIEAGRRSLESLDTFTVTFAAVTGKDIAIVLTRNGLDWQLTNVRLPAGSVLN